MLVNAKNIIGAKTITRSGQHLGRVADFEIDMDCHRIGKYFIHSDLLGFLKEPLIINASQIIGFKNNRLIVEDAVLPHNPEKQTAPEIKSSIKSNYAG